MPRAPKLCGADCSAVATKGAYCDTHQPVPFAGAKDRWKARRPGNWETLRRKVIRRARGLCEVEGCLARGSDVDHVNPVAEQGLWALSNLQYLCQAHHRRKTQEEARRGRQRSMRRAA